MANWREIEEWNTEKTYIAWELAADWGWDEEFVAMIEGGRICYEQLTCSRNDSVRCARLATTTDNRLYQINRYVSGGTHMRLVPIAQAKGIV